MRDVEDAGVTYQGLVRAPRRSQDLVCADRSVDDKGEVAMDRLEGRNLQRRAGLAALLFRLWDLVEEDLERGGWSTVVETTQDFRMHFAEIG